MKKEREKIKSRERGITLIALVITIVILIILATVAINFAFGESGLITKANLAKEQTDTAGEKEEIALAVLDARSRNNGNIDKEKLQQALDSNVGEGKTTVTYDSEESVYYVTFKDSKRIYEVTEDGQVVYLGKEEELMSKATLTVSPESSTIPQLYYQIEVESTIPMKVDKYMLVYAWSNSKDNMPADEEFIDSGAIGTGRTLKASIPSTDTDEGDYYLWIRMVVGEQEKTQCFGPYKIKDHTTLVATTNEKESTSGFLGNENIQRGLIKSINIVTTLEGHSLSDSNCWDVTQGQNGKYMAWYEEEKGYYNVTIAGEGGVVANSNSRYLFGNIGYGVENEEVTIEGLENLDTGLVTNMGNMFNKSKVQTLDLNSFNTSNVTSLFSTFEDCTNLKNLYVNNWDTSNVKEMGESWGYYGYGGTFQNCSSLTKLDISNWDTSSVVGMGQMFAGCTSLTQIDTSNFNTDNVKSFYAMFNNCKNLIDINTNNFNTSKALYINTMFSNCTSLTELDVSNFDTSNVTNMTNMFNNCTSITQLDVSDFDTSNVTSMQGMFNNCTNLTQIDVSNFDTSKVTTMLYMFNNCLNLIQIDVSNFNTSKVTTMQNMFANCTSLKQLDVTNFDTSKVTTMQGMFANCTSLTQIDVSDFDTSNVTSMQWMFSNCTNLAELGLSNFDTSKVTTMEYMFNNCTSLTQLDLSKFNTNNIITMQSMFGNCRNITTIYVSKYEEKTGKGWTTTDVTNSANMFNGCSSIIGGNGTAYNLNYTDATYARIDTPSTPGYFTNITDKQ